MALNRKPPAKRIASFSYVKYTGFLTLYLDDVQDVLDYITTSGGTPSLSAAHASADAAIDLQECSAKELRDVSIRVPEPQVDVFIGRDTSAVRTVQDDPVAIGMVDGINALLRERRTMFRGTVGMLWRRGWFFVVVTIAALLFFGVVFLIGKPAPLVAWTVPAYSATLLIFVWFGFRRAAGAKVIPERRADSRRLGSATRAALVAGITTGIVGAVIGAVVGSVLTYLLTRP